MIIQIVYVPNPTNGPYGVLNHMTRWKNILRIVQIKTQ